MGVCCNCDKQEIMTEIKKGTMAEGTGTFNNFSNYKFYRADFSALFCS